VRKFKFLLQPKPAAWEPFTYVRVQPNYSGETLHCVSKNVTPLTWYNLDIHEPIAIIFGECHWESKESDDALFSHLTYLVLLHYLAKEGTQKTEHWSIVHSTQSNVCSALDFLSPEPCPTKAPSWMHWLQDLGSHTASWVWVVSQKDWRNQATTGRILAMH